MKTLLTFLLFAISSVAFANNTDKQTPPENTEKRVATGISTKKEATATLKNDEDRDKDKTKSPAKTHSVRCTSVDGSRFNLSAYFAEFVNDNNLKLVKLLLE